MRKILSSGLIGFGAFLLLAGALIHFYAYPQLAQNPTNLTNVTHLEAHGAQVFVAAKLKPVTTDLAIVARTMADSSQDWPGKTSVWVNTNTVSFVGGDLDGKTFQQTTDRVPFGSVSGAGVSCDVCDGYMEVPGPGGMGNTKIDTDFVDPTLGAAQVLKFPFDTQKHDYAQWDDNLGAAVMATYVDTEKLDGLTVYKFVQHVDPTTINTEEVPGSVFGSSEASVKADLVYSITRTFYIEPVTGAPVNRIDDMSQTLQHDGQTVPAFVGSVAYTPDTVASLVKDAKSQAPALHAMKLIFPAIAWLLGLVAIGGGLLLRRRSSKQTASVDGDDRSLVNA